MKSLKEIRKPIQSEMETFQTYFHHSIKRDLPYIRLIINYILRNKGKQIRPVYVFLTAKMLGNVNRSTYTAASLIELLHTATLIHDDVVDESFERRGRFSINALWKSKASVLIGDYLLSRGLLLSIEETEYHLLHTVSEAVQLMSEGELLQTRNSRKLHVSEDFYFDVITKKTASLFASCFACGAQSVGASVSTIEKVKEIGNHAGIIFQIKDDIIDFQKTNAFGKPTGNDIKEKKITLPLIYALNNATGKERKQVIRILKKRITSTTDINYINQFVKANGGIEYAQQKMESYKEKALQLLQGCPFNIYNQAIQETFTYLISRKK